MKYEKSILTFSFAEKMWPVLACRWEWRVWELSGHSKERSNACILHCEDFYSKKHKDEKGESTNDGYHQLSNTSQSFFKKTGGITETG